MKTSHDPETAPSRTSAAHRLAGLSPAGAAGTAACCLAPASLSAMGLGGAWLAVFTPLIALALPLAGLAVLVVLVGWGLALRRRARPTPRLILQTVLTAAAIAIVLNEARVIAALT